MQPSGDRIDVVKSLHGWTVCGEVDAAVSERLDHELEDLPEIAEGPIEIDLAGVTFIDSSGLRVLLRLADRIAIAGGTVIMRNPSDVVTRLITVTKLEATFGLDVIESDTSSELPFRHRS